MTEWSKDLLLYRMNRADETFEDARILANAGRWNACVNRLYYAWGSGTLFNNLVDVVRG